MFDIAVKVYGITSSGGSDPERRNLEQKVMLANSVAQSFMSPDNVNSRGQRMFLVRRQNAEKWTKSGPDPQPEDGGAWPQRAPAVSHPNYITGHTPPRQDRPLPARQQSLSQHPVPSGPRLGRSTSVQALTPAHRQGQFVPPGPGVPSTPPQERRGGSGPQQPPQGYLIPARPLHGPLPGQDSAGTPTQQRRSRAESFGSLPVADVRPNQADWQMSVPSQQQRDWNLDSGQQQHPQQMRLWPASLSPPQPVTSAASSYYGVTDL